MKAIPLVRMTSLAVALGCAVAVAQGWRRPCVADPYNGVDDRLPIDLVICLDTSGSMTGLIDSARAKLWDVVNQLAKARPTPRLRVGLLTYGSPNRSSATQGWVVRQSDLTGDLDLIYDRMMSMTTNGGDEFVGWVLNDALGTMSWSRDSRALKLIYVAGNESADQASNMANFRSVGLQAREAGITINAIYCGNWQTGRHELWHEVAQCGGGDYSAIDMARGTIQIQSPYDREIMELNIRLNATYIPYGLRGDEGRARQLAQDSNAVAVGDQAAPSRVAAKASPLYENSAWDLVDASKRREFRMKDVKEAELPPAMQAMSEQERIAFVERQAADRTEVQRKIQELNTRRDAYLQEEQKKQNNGQVGLDEALKQSIQKQAEAKGFKF